ncbi:MAG: hypothetical protein ACO4CT_10110 [Planctomycetota bacterium]|jgi:hypothetical protein
MGGLVTRRSALGDLAGPGGPPYPAIPGHERAACADAPAERAFAPGSTLPGGRSRTISAQLAADQPSHLTAREEPSLASHGDLSDRALAAVVVDLATAAAKIATEPVGVAVEAPCRSTDLRIRQQVDFELGDPLAQLAEDRGGLLLPEQLAMLRAEVSVSRLSLDAVEHPNRLQRRLGLLGSVRQRFEEFAPRVGHEGRVGVGRDAGVRPEEGTPEPRSAWRCG